MLLTASRKVIGINASIRHGYCDLLPGQGTTTAQLSAFVCLCVVQHPRVAVVYDGILKEHPARALP